MIYQLDTPSSEGSSAEQLLFTLALLGPTREERRERTLRAYVSQPVIPWRQMTTAEVEWVRHLEPAEVLAIRASPPDCMALTEADLLARQALSDPRKRAQRELNRRAVKAAVSDADFAQLELRLVSGALAARKTPAPDGEPCTITGRFTQNRLHTLLYGSGSEK